MLDNTAISADIALHTYRPEPFPESLDIPRVEPSARALVVKMGAQGQPEKREFGNRFGKMWSEYHAKNAPMVAPIALLAVIFAGAVLKLTYGG